MWSAIRLDATKNPARGTVIATSSDRDAILQYWKPGEVCISWTCHTEIKHWTPEAKAKGRLTRTKKRLAKKFPLFADQFLETELATRKDYFEGR